MFQVLPGRWHPPPLPVPQILRNARWVKQSYLRLDASSQPLNERRRKRIHLRMKKLRMSYIAFIRQRSSVYNITEVRSLILDCIVPLTPPGMVGPGEEVLLVREPQNPYDR